MIIVPRFMRANYSVFRPRTLQKTFSNACVVSKKQSVSMC